MAFGSARDDLRERRFTGAGRAVEDERLDAIGFNRAAQQLSWPEDVRLPGELCEIARPHPRGERLRSTRRFGCLGFRFSRGGKQIVRWHGLNIV